MCCAKSVERYFHALTRLRMQAFLGRMRSESVLEKFEVRPTPLREGVFRLERLSLLMASAIL
jgi:hypothetical protein